MVAIARECCLEIAYWLASGRAHLYRSPPEEYDRPNSLLGCIIPVASNAAYTDERTCQAPGSSSTTAIGPGRGAKTRKRPSMRNGAGLDAGNCRVKPRPIKPWTLPLIDARQAIEILWDALRPGHPLPGRSGAKHAVLHGGRPCSRARTSLRHAVARLTSHCHASRRTAGTVRSVPGPPQTLASPFRPTALVPVRPVRFGACRPSSP